MIASFEDMPKREATFTARGGLYQLTKLVGAVRVGHIQVCNSVTEKEVQKIIDEDEFEVIIVAK